MKSRKALGSGLLGSYGAPLLPETWILRPATLWETVSPSADSESEIIELLKKNSFRQSIDSVDWDLLAEHAAATNVSFSDHWIQVRPSDVWNIPRDLWIEELPLLLSTITTLQVMQIPLDNELWTVLNHDRFEFLDIAGGALALLDLELQAESSIRNMTTKSNQSKGRGVETLEDCAASILDEYRALDGDRLSSEWTEFFLRRFSWGYPKATLDEIGQDAGVTRERVRQIQSQLASYVGWRRWPLPEVLSMLLKVLKNNDFTNTQETLAQTSFVVDEDWTPSEIVQLYEWFGYSDIAALLDQEFSVAADQLDLVTEEKKQLKKLIRRHRSKCGLLNLTSVHLPNGQQADPKHVRALTKEIYPYYFEFGDWVLCGIHSDLTPVERKAVQQLSIASPLSVEELQEGLERYRRCKALPAYPPMNILLSLMERSGILKNADKGVVATRTIQFEGISAWLTMQFLEAEEQVIHKDMIYRAAIQDHHNISTVSSAFLYNSLLRPLDEPKGVMRLVGSNPSEESAESARHVADALHEPSNLGFQVKIDRIALEIQMGSYAVSSGIYKARDELGQLWPAGGAGIVCFCSRDFAGKIKKTNGGQLTGWHPLVAHVMLEHKGQVGTVVRAQLIDDEIQVLQIDQYL